MFFFFKQKTAYEMRISDWSSDVCSSDLSAFAAPTSFPVPHPEMRPSGSEIAPGATFPPAPPSQLDHHPIRLAFQERQFATWPLALSDRRASCRERVCQYVYVSVGAGSLKTKIEETTDKHKSKNKK